MNQSLPDLAVQANEPVLDTPSPSLSPAATRRSPDDRLNVVSSLAFFAVHLIPFLAIFTGVTRAYPSEAVLLTYPRLPAIRKTFWRNNPTLSIGISYMPFR